MVRMPINVDELRVKKPAGVHQWCQLGSHVLRDIAHEELAEERHADSVGIVRILYLADQGIAMDVATAPFF